MEYERDGKKNNTHNDVENSFSIKEKNHDLVRTENPLYYDKDYNDIKLNTLNLVFEISNPFCIPSHTIMLQCPSLPNLISVD